MSAVQAPTPVEREAEPAWQIARLFPAQGQWSDAAYLRLAANTNHFVELTDGWIDVLPMPKPSHQRILALLFKLFEAFATNGGLGEVLFSPMPVRMRRGKYREPDLVFLSNQNKQQAGDDCWERADLALEVVSDDSRARDLQEKPQDYAEGGISEYWIVDPRDELITVLRLVNGAYVAHGKFKRGDRATSVLLAGFSVDVAGVFDAAQR